jgi:membrane dipeptidase
LVHSYDNELATSSGTPGPHAHGLTSAGREVTGRVFHAGALVDVSHASDRATADVLDIAEDVGGTVIATHSNAQSLAEHPRNLSDALARRIAKTGGVVGVNFHSRFLLGRGGRAQLSDVVRHVRHLVDVVGVDHVAIGSDFEGGIRPPAELADVGGVAKLSRALVDAGLSSESVGKIFQRNAVRVLCTLRPTGASGPAGS